MILTPEEKAAFLQLMETFDDKLANAGCNDMALDNTPGNRELVKQAWIFNFHGDEEKALEGIGQRLDTKEQTIITSDFLVLGYILGKLKKAL